TAMNVPGTGKLNDGELGAVEAVSCGPSGECAAGGVYSGVGPDGVVDWDAFVVSETNGSWGKAVQVPGTAAFEKYGVAETRSVSCAAAGGCTAAGYYYVGLVAARAFVV